MEKKTSLKELNKPAKALQKFVDPNQNEVLHMTRDLKGIGSRIGVTPPALKKGSLMGSTTTALKIARKRHGGAIDLGELQEHRATGEVFREHQTEEKAMRDFPEHPAVVQRNPPNVAGVPSMDTMSGYATTTRPYAMHCTKGHTIPARMRLFTDGRSVYCPYCGDPLHIK